VAMITEPLAKGKEEKKEYKNTSLLGLSPF